ncbi:baeRF10 domain-containing protein [Halalkalicoccus jeotgali]|uniref:Peptide chain release factor 1 n=1 Tax=Halalkalicoccus jeotgali (strain DSM 18796 / CECT 7217 / JCM 14584 / KCTC 4019 / B3) TaxID=795797 RepID=D8J5H4_HALJB|nr:peptide chain release factor 1 [Halalkalicoccus jeotgali]ADJ15670.1 peptide chain release factor 1 [Halalkalicoccus jeotgali B3]ELY36560.1 peptide chain release factor 1 [Halalkalicoccus jeotgali B3]
MSAARNDLHERIEAVEEASADRTALVTVAIPPEEDLEAVRNRIERDHANSEYGDSGPVNSDVEESLEALRGRLREYDTVPENGLVAYVGVVDEELVEYVFDELPTSVEEFRYEQANEFDTAPLESTGGPDATYGLLVVERGEAALGRLEGEEIVPIDTLENEVAEETPTADNAPESVEGGDLQSRQTEWKEGFFDDVADAAERAFLGEDPVDNLLIGGTEITIEEFTGEDRLDHRLRDRLAGTYPVEYASEQGLRQLTERAEGQLTEAEDRPAREALDTFFERVDDGEEVAYGYEKVDEALTYDAVETLLLAESVPAEEASELAERAEDIEADHVIVPTGIERGEQFEEGFEGYGALLRFEID